MTLVEFVTKAVNGELTIRQGGEQDGKLVTKTGPVKLTDPEDITAEAFAQGIVDFNEDWDETLATVTELLGQRAAGGPGSGNWGHEGRPGEVGGSGEGGGSTWEEKKQSAADRLQKIRTDLEAKAGGSLVYQGYHIYGGEKRHQDVMRLERGLDEAVSSGKITNDEREEFIIAYASNEKILMEDDDHYDDRRVEFADEWKDSSSSYGGTAMKEAIRTKFGSDTLVYNPNGYKIGPLARAEHSALLDRMYKETQSEMDQLLPKGVPRPEEGWDGKKLTLFRGMHKNKGIAGTIESWSVNRNIARNFGRTRKKEFSRSQVLTWHLSKTWRGEGQLQSQEKEFVIIRKIK